MTGETPSPFEVVLLGTGSPIPGPDRCGTGHVVIAGDTRVLVDCGWGAGRRLFAAGVPPPLINVVCFTHMHSDHITDVPDFLMTRWTGGAQAPLTVYGPEGTRDMIDGFLAALARDIGFRFAHHGDKLSREGIRCVVNELPAEADAVPVAELDGLAIKAFEVDHRPVVPALGYRFEYQGRTLAFSGDTKPCDSLVQGARDADLFVCEALNLAMFNAFLETVRERNPNMAAILDDAIAYHSATEDVARMARDAGVRHLVLSHLMPAVPPDDAKALADFTAGMSDVFAGRLTVGRDLQRLVVGEAEG